MAFTDIDTDTLFASMFGAARKEAGDAWSQLRGVCKIELKAMARQIKEVAKSVSTKEITPEVGRTILRLSRTNSITAIAAMTPLTFASVERVVTTATGEVRDAVAKAVGLELL